MKTDPQYTSSASGYLTGGFEGVSERFTQLTTVSVRGHNILTKGQRYGRWYLLKSLSADVAGQSLYQEMLTKEFELTMRAQHPGVVQAISMEQVPNLGRCIVLEWVEGKDMKRWLDDDPPREARRRVMGQLLDAVKYLHEKGIAHRDLKPSNIMITQNGKTPKIIDFGLADTDVHAVLKQPAGTEQYMSPEQTSSATPDVRNDIYSLGVMMRQMDLGQIYHSVALRCMRPINERYQSIDDLQRDLKRRQMAWRWLCSAMVFILLAAIAAMAWFKWALRQVVDNSALVDSLRQEIVINNTRLQASNASQRQMKETMHQRLSTLNDSLALLAKSNESFQKEKEEREERQRKIDAAIVEGIRRADIANARTHLKEHADTVNRDFHHIWVDWNYLSKAGRREAEAYLHSIHDQYNPKEMAEIEYAVMEHCKEWEQRIYRRLFEDPKKGKE